LSQVSTLRLSSAALKPNVQHEDPDTKVTLVKVASIPIIPTDTFASAASISIKDCKVGEIESYAFSGEQHSGNFHILEKFLKVFIFLFVIAKLSY